jgi:hypothetical protein
MNFWLQSNDPTTPATERPRVISEHKSRSELPLSNGGRRDVIS